MPMMKRRGCEKNTGRDMTAKEYLLQYRKLKTRIEDLRSDIYELGEAVTSVKSLSDNDGMPHGSGYNNKTERQIAALVDKKREYQQLLIDLENKKIEICETIDSLEDPVMIRLLRDRYIKLLGGEEIAVNIGYTPAHTRGYLHLNSLRAISEKVNTH